MLTKDSGPWPRVCLVGPLPPPSGGMANQCEQLVRLLAGEGLAVELVQTNAPYRPARVGRIPIVRAFFRLVPYARHVWRAAGRTQVMHILANSGWAWHLIAGPAIFAARRRRVPVIVNYRGGAAEGFFASAPRLGARTACAACRCASLRRATCSASSPSSASTLRSFRTSSTCRVSRGARNASPARRRTFSWRATSNRSTTCRRPCAHSDASARASPAQP